MRPQHLSCILRQFATTADYWQFDPIRYVSVRQTCSHSRYRNCKQSRQRYHQITAGENLGRMGTYPRFRLDSSSHNDQ